MGLHDSLLKPVSGWDGNIGDVVDVDGKALRRSLKDAARAAAPRACLLGQVRVDSKSKEFTAMPALLELLDLKDRIAAADAMNAQRATAEEITRRGGDYALSPESSREMPRDDIRFHMADPDNAKKC